MKTKLQNQALKPGDEAGSAFKSEMETAREIAGLGANSARCPPPRKSERFIRSVRPWLVFIAVAMVVALQAKAIDVFAQYGFQTFSVDDSGLAAGPNGTVFGPWNGGILSENQGISLYTPIAGSDKYSQFFIANPPCAGNTNPVVNIVVNPDGTITANTATGGANGTGATYTVNKNGTVLCCADRPETEGRPTGDIATSQFGGDYIYWLDEVSGSSSNQTVEVEAFDLTPCPPEEIVDPPLPVGDSNPNGLALYQGGTTPNTLSGYVLYGTTEYGGTYGAGILYSINGDGSGFQVLHNFGPGSTNGEYPRGNVIFSADGGTLYGTASSPNGGVIYAISTNGMGYTNLFSFNNFLTTGNMPAGDLYLIGDTLYGTAANGGNFMVNDDESQSAAGVIFSVKTNGTSFNVLYTFPPLSLGKNSNSGYYTNTYGAAPETGVILSSNNLVGATSAGGVDGYGTLFALTLGPPVITNQPANQALDFGDAVVIPVGVDGAGPFHYQWQLNGTNLTDQFSTNNPYAIYGILLNSNQLGGYSVIITNAYGSVTSSVATLSLSILQNDSFENNSLTGWTVSSDANASVEDGYYREPLFDAIPVSYSGTFLAYLQNQTLNQMDSISQAAPTLAGQSYLLSFWLNTSRLSSGYSNVFSVSWNGSVVFSQTNIPTGTNSLFGSGNPSAGWTNIQCTVAGSGSNVLLQFGFQTGNAGDAFILDEVALVPQLPQFTATPSVGSPPLAVQFAAPLTDTNGNALVGWDWNFGDGSTSAAQNPSHTFNTAGIYTPALTGTNSEGQAIAVLGPVVDVFVPPLQNGGFETGSLAPWTTSGNNAGMFVFAFPSLAHTGNDSLAANAAGSPGYLSQTVGTTAGTQYLLSFWLNNGQGAAPDDFSAIWNGITLLNLTNLPELGWTNFQFTVTATASSTPLEFGFLNNGYFFFDDVSLTPLVTTPPSPIPLNLQLSGNQLILNWTNPAFSLQTAPTVTGAWLNVSGASPPYTNATTNRQTFFRLAH